MNKNYQVTLDIRYKRQQEAIKEVCKDLNLIAFYPNYHADKTDNNTVLIYTQDAHEYNRILPEYARNEEYKPCLCYFENTDINGHFSLNWLCKGKIDCRGINEKERIKNYIIQKLENNI